MAQIDDSNIFKSQLADISNYEGLYIHDITWKNIELWQNKTAVVCSTSDKSYTYKELRKLCGKFATSLRRNNIQPGDTIAIILPNVLEFSIITLGASEAGVKVTLISPLYTAHEMKRQLKNSEAVAIITIPILYPTVRQSFQENSAIRLLIIVTEDGHDSQLSDTMNFGNLIADDVEEFEKTGLNTELNPDDTFVLPYSSGTTGLPKGVEITHRNLVATILQQQADEVCSMLEGIDDYQDIIPLLLPMYHIFGFMLLLGSISTGAKSIFISKFSSDELRNTLNKHKATVLYIVPPIVQLLVSDKRFTTQHMKSVRTVISGGAAFDEEIIDNFYKCFGNHIILTQGYGLSETGASSTRSKDSPPISCGKIVPSTEIRIVGCERENKGKNLGINEYGEIYIRGPQVMKGYFKNPSATQACMEDDWFKTGDIGLIDEQGLLYIRGRLKELIKIQGYQVAPAELEEIISKHENVADVAVIGVSHDKFGEIPKAFIVPKPNTQIDEQEIKDLVARNAAKYKQLGYVTIIDKIPKNAAGKILRKELQKI